MRILFVLIALVFGAGLAAQGQEIDVERNGDSVPSGTTVDLGDVDVRETTQVDFTIRNEGVTDLTLTGGVAVTDTDDCDATVQQPGLTTIPPGGSTTFQVSITNDGGGTFSCDISIPNDDTDEGSYQFIIQGDAEADDSKNHNESECSTGTGTSGLLMFGGLAAIGAVALRRRKRQA
jgi:MYXO-CTERM domain-containing protein